eukprot:Skav216852  [mRNA]  locus=scaffold1042:31746:34891:+ [translate_table: standard]
MGETLTTLDKKMEHLGLASAREQKRDQVQGTDWRNSDHCNQDHQGRGCVDRPGGLQGAALERSAVTNGDQQSEEFEAAERGASSAKYRIITADKPQIEVAQTETEEEFLGLLRRLNSLTVSDVLAAVSSNRREVLEQMINKAKADRQMDRQGHQEFLSIEMLQKIASLEGEKAALQGELEEAQKALRAKEVEQHKLQDD